MKGIPVTRTEIKRFLTEREAATYAGMTINEFRRSCPITAHQRAQNRKVWDVVDLDTWFDNRGYSSMPTITPDDVVARLS